MSPNSKSVWLTTLFSTMFFAGLVLFGLVMWLDLDHVLTSASYETLDRRAQPLADLLKSWQNLPYEARIEKFQEFADATGGGLIEVFNEGGTRTFPSPTNASATFTWPDVSELVSETSTTVVCSRQRYRVLLRPISAGDQRFILALAAPLAGNNALLRKFLFGLLSVVPGALLLSTMAGYFVSRKALTTTVAPSVAA